MFFILVILLAVQTKAGYIGTDCACALNGDQEIFSASDRVTSMTYMTPNECLTVVNGSVGEAWVMVNYTLDAILSNLNMTGYLPVNENVAVAKCDYLKSPPTVTCSTGQMQIGGQCYETDALVQNCKKNVCPTGASCIAMLSEHVRGLYCICDASGDPIKAALQGDCGCPTGHVKNVNGSCSEIDQCQVSRLCGNGICTANYTAYGCKCDVGWTGSSCSEAKTHCGNVYCYQGHCDSTSAVPKCVCNQNWSGLSCDQCGGDLCMYGTCLNFYNGTYKCHCDNGITGSYCSQVHHSCKGVSIGGHCYSAVEDENCKENVCFGTEQCKVIKTDVAHMGVYCTCDENHYNPNTCRCNKDQYSDIHGNCVGACFPGKAIVQLQNGKSIPIADLKIGDFILTLDSDNNAIHSEVILMMHNDPEPRFEYLTIYTEGGKSIRISRNHLVFTARHLNETFDSKFAETIRPGDYLKRWDSFDGKYNVGKVVKIVRNTMQGFFAPLTMDGSLIVDGHFVSSYAVYDDHNFIHSLFAPWRVFYYLKSLVWSTPPFRQDHDGIHWSVKLIPRVLCSIYWTDYCHNMGGTVG